MNRVEVHLNETGHGSIIIDGIPLKTTMGIQFVSTPGSAPLVRLRVLGHVKLDVLGQTQTNEGSNRQPIEPGYNGENIWSKIVIAADAFGHGSISVDGVILTDVAEVDVTIMHERPTTVTLSFRAEVDLEMPAGILALE